MTSSWAKQLLAWYQKSARDLPWRRTSDPYKIWISEVMLQQTTVQAVIPYFERWISRFPTVNDVRKASLQTILTAWQGLGYYQRAKNIHKAATIFCCDFNGQIPQDAQVLRKVPGFGPYTVGAVLSIAFDQRMPIIDANVRRVVMRQLAIEGMATPEHDQKILKFLDEVMPANDLRSFNQALMELGALVCKTANPLCLACPIKKSCRAFRKGLQEVIPTPKEKNIKTIEAVIGIISNGTSFYIQKRPSKGLLADLWEFPGGKLEKEESHLKALQRELKEELDVDVISAKEFGTVTHSYTQFKVNLHVYWTQLRAYPKVDETHVWVTLNKISAYPMPSGSARIVDLLKSSTRK